MAGLAGVLDALLESVVENGGESEISASLNGESDVPSTSQWRNPQKVGIPPVNGNPVSLVAFEDRSLGLPQGGVEFQFANTSDDAVQKFGEGGAVLMTLPYTCSSGFMTAIRANGEQTLFCLQGAPNFTNDDQSLAENPSAGIFAPAADGYSCGYNTIDGNPGYILPIYSSTDGSMNSMVQTYPGQMSTFLGVACLTRDAFAYTNDAPSQPSPPNDWGYIPPSDFDVLGPVSDFTVSETPALDPNAVLGACPGSQVCMTESNNGQWTHCGSIGYDPDCSCESFAVYGTSYWLPAAASGCN